MSLIKTFLDGIGTKNPIFRLALGIVSALGITHLALNGLYMGVLTTIVLFCAVVIKIGTRRFLSKDTQYFVDFASLVLFTTVLYRLVGVYRPDILVRLGIYFPLITINGFLLQRLSVEQKPLVRLIDAIGMGIGYTLALLLIGVIRELVGLGQLFDIQVFNGTLAPFSLAATVPGGMIIIGLLMALYNTLFNKGDASND